MGVSLTKGGNISLTKVAPGMSSSILGLGWGKKKTKGFFGGTKHIDVDLDASCLMFDENNQPVDVIWFQQLMSKDGSIVHTGDDLTGGGGEGVPNEEIHVKLDRIPANVKSLVFTVNSFSNDSFEGIPNAFCVLKDKDSGNEVARYDLSVSGSYTGLIIAKLYRHNGEWKMKAIGDFGHGRTFDKLLPLMQQSL